AGAVVVVREINPLVGQTRLKSRSDDFQYVVAVPLQGDFLALLAFGFHLLEGSLADEVVFLPADVEVVTQFEGADVVVFDVVGEQRATQRAYGFVVVGTQPVAVVLQHAVAGVDARQRARDPAGFQSVGGVGTRANEAQVDAGSLGGFGNGGLDV